MTMKIDARPRTWMLALGAALILVALVLVAGNAFAGSSTGNPCLPTNHPQYQVGTAADDHLCGGNSADRIWGNAGQDIIAGNHGNDVLDGGSGADRIWPGKGTDKVDCGSGTDTVYVNFKPAHETYVACEVFIDPA